MSLLSKLFGGSKRTKESGRSDGPKPKYKHYGQRPKADSKRQNRFGPKKD